MNIQLIDVQQEAYLKMLALRWQVLLQPIGVPESYMDSQREKNDLLVAAMDGNEVIGCCILSHLNNELLQLRQMAVDKTKQHIGVGRAIVAYAEKLSKAKGYKILMMHARDAVIPFYEKCGYKIAGKGFTEVGIPHHRMEKVL